MEFWIGLPRWVRVLAALAVLAYPCYALAHGVLWPWGFGVGLVLLALAAPRPMAPPPPPRPPIR